MGMLHPIYTDWSKWLRKYGAFGDLANNNILCSDDWQLADAYGPRVICLPKLLPTAPSKLPNIRLVSR